MLGVRRRILVVEDDPETAGQLVDSLTTSGYQVELADNAKDALHRGRSATYAVMTIESTRHLPLSFDCVTRTRNLNSLPSFIFITPSKAASFRSGAKLSPLITCDAICW